MSPIAADRRCPKCGGRVFPTDDRCMDCATTLSSGGASLDEPPSGESNAQNRISGWVIWTSLVLMMMLTWVGVFWLYDPFELWLLPAIMALLVAWSIPAAMASLSAAATIAVIVLIYWAVTKSAVKHGNVEAQDTKSSSDENDDGL